MRHTLFIVSFFAALALSGSAFAQDDFSSVPSGLLLSPEQRAQQRADVTSAAENAVPSVDPQVLTQPVDVLTGQAQHTARVADLASLQAAYAQKKYAEIVAPLEAYAQEGNAQATLLLAVMLQNGQGVAVDAPRATRLFAQAAEAGVAAAQERLALNLASGFGVEKNPRLALMWLTIAEVSYPDAATKNRVRAARESFAAQLSRSDQDAGLLMARQWLEKKGKGHLLPTGATEK